MADLALAIATPVAATPGAATPAKTAVATGVTDPFAILMAAANPAAPTTPVAKLPAAANADETVLPDVTEKTDDDGSATEDGDTDAATNPDALLALLTAPVPITQPVMAVPTTIPAAATATGTTDLVSFAKPAAQFPQSFAPVKATRFAATDDEAPAIPPTVVAPTTAKTATADQASLVPEPVIPTTDIANTDEQTPVVSPTMIAATTINTAAVDDQAATSAAQTSILALVQTMRGSVDTAPAQPQIPQAAAQATTASIMPPVTGDATPAIVEAEQAASVVVVTPSPRNVRMIAPKLDRAASVTVGAKPAETIKARAPAAKTATPQERARPVAERADDTATPQPQVASTPAHDAAPIAKAADIGSVDAVVTRHLAVARDGQWLDSLAKDIVATGGNNSSLSFTLSPEHLGALKVDITQGADGASVHMTTDTDAARNIILDAQPRLAAEARAQGLTLKDTSVSTNSDPQRQAQSQAQQQPSSQSSGQQGGQDRRAFAQTAPQPLAPILPTATDEESDGALYA